MRVRLRLLYQIAGFAISWLSGSALTCASEGVRLSLVPLSNNRVTLTWTNAPGYVYQVQFKTNLADPVWLTILGDVTSTNTVYSKEHSVGTATQRFFRVNNLGRKEVAPLSYYAGDFWIGDNFYGGFGKMPRWNRLFDQVLIKFREPYTNGMFTTKSDTVLKLRYVIATEGSWWSAMDGVSTGDRITDLRVLLASLQ